MSMSKMVNILSVEDSGKLTKCKQKHHLIIFFNKKKIKVII